MGYVGIMASLIGIISYFYKKEELHLYLCPRLSKTKFNIIFLVFLFIMSFLIDIAYKNFFIANELPQALTAEIRHNAEVDEDTQSVGKNENTTLNKDVSETTPRHDSKKVKIEVLLNNAAKIDNYLARDSEYEEITKHILERKEFSNLHLAIGKISNYLTRDRLYIESLEYLLNHNGDIEVASKLAGKISNYLTRSDAYAKINTKIRQEK